MKVLMIEQFYPESSYTVELGRELGKQCDLNVFCKKSNPPSIEGIHWISEFYPGGAGKVKAMLLYAQSLLKLKNLICGGYDVVHIHTFKDPHFEIPIYLKNRKHYGHLVHTVHNLLPHEAVESDVKLYTDFYQTCDKLIVHNEWCKKQLIRNFRVPEEKVVVTPHGAYALVGKADKREDADGKTRFLQFGICRKYKGIDISLKALSLLSAEERSHIHLTIAGMQFAKLDDTDYTGMIQTLGLSDCVTFEKRFIRDEEIPGLFGAADVALFPYREIYGSGALLMAYTYGCPVIASDIPVFREETDDGKTGLLFESENPEAMAKAFRTALGWSAAEKAQYSQRIAELIRVKYNWAASAELLYKAYTSLK